MSNKHDLPPSDLDAAPARLLHQLSARAVREYARTLRSDNQSLRDRVQRLEAENEALKKDAARLDAIERNARCDPKMDGNHVWWPTTWNHRLTGPTLRAAIDAAMTKEQKT